MRRYAFAYRKRETGDDLKGLFPLSLKYVTPWPIDGVIVSRGLANADLVPAEGRSFNVDM